MKGRILLLLVTGLLCLASPLLALNDSTVRDQPVEITADRLEADDTIHKLVFVGNAVAKQGDITIYAERLTVHYAATGNDVDEVVAEGQVRIVQGSRVATGQKAVFMQADGKVVLTGSPKVQEGDSLVQGTEITLYLNEKRSVVQGGQDGRVNAVFVPKSEKNP